jgi:hypothetical protein
MCIRSRFTNIDCALPTIRHTTDRFILRLHLLHMLCSTCRYSASLHLKNNPEGRKTPRLAALMPSCYPKSGILVITKIVVLWMATWLRIVRRCTRLAARRCTRRRSRHSGGRKARCNTRRGQRQGVEHGRRRGVERDEACGHHHN